MDDFINTFESVSVAKRDTLSPARWLSIGERACSLAKRNKDGGFTEEKN